VAQRLSALGWRFEVHAVGSRFFCALGARAGERAGAL
jgi:hypothetical protein